MNGVLESQLEREFVEVALKWSELLSRGEPKKANREYDRLHELKNKMRTLPDRGEAALKRITAHDDLELRMLAAAALLAVDEPYATRVLEEIAMRSVGTRSFEADMTLKQWRKGAIKEYWS
jgi:hypothetical protein